MTPKDVVSSWLLLQGCCHRDSPAHLDTYSNIEVSTGLGITRTALFTQTPSRHTLGANDISVILAIAILPVVSAEV